jgi:hypothetical protein
VSVFRGRSRMRPAIALGAVGLAITLAVSAIVMWRESASERRAPVASVQELPSLPHPEPLEVIPLTVQEATAANAAIPFSSQPLEAAAPFALADADPFTRNSALDCLTAAIYYEAASESAQGQRAVAQVVLNRVRHPAFPPSICDVVYQGSQRKTGCQFTFTCDGSLSSKPSRAGWDRARRVATMALAGAVEPSVGTATHYHANWVVPYWASELDKITAIGAHIFYRWSGYWGKRQAFAQRYAGEQVLAPDTMSSMPVLEGSGELSDSDLMGSSSPLDQLLRPLAEQEQEIQEDASVGPPAIDDNSNTLLVDERKPELIIDGVRVP